MEDDFWKIWNELASQKAKTYTLQSDDMKLLMCLECGDIFNLTRKEKQCSCGQTKGMYIDELNAKIAGNCQPIGIANGSFREAIQIQRIQDKKPKKKNECCRGVKFTAFFIPASATYILKS